LYQQYQRANIASWFSHFFEWALVNRVIRRQCIRVLRLWRSTWLVEMRDSFGFPQTGLRSTSIIVAGE
jgi:hypothetical protein